ncbi:MAG TPA: protein kinase [Polyangiaceae bacterium]|nr:protein kinase [Polyangiaceae bacterium]
MLGRYELLLPIAAGGMAMVWAARVKGTRGFQKIVAVKTMLSKLSEDAQFEQMFLDEASLASQIRHPNVVEISDLGEQEGVLYLAMEWIDGVPLNQLMKVAKPAGGVPLPVAVRIVMNACAGLHAAHELRDGKGQLIGLVHRDVSPQNILVTYDGVSKVVDFGVAKATAMGGGATMAGQLKGKVSYMAPEQVRGEAIDRRVDIFALGIVLYALTTGKHPFRRENEAATMYTIASTDPVVAPRKFLPDYPAGLEAVLLKALAKNPAERYGTASEFLRALDQCLPASEKAQTDEDVGIFIGKLFGKKRDESRAALAEALALADKQSPRGPGSASGTGSHNALTQSQVSSLSTVGVAASLAPEATFTSVGAPERAVAARRKRMVLFSVAGAVLLACAVAIALKKSNSNVSESSAPAAQLPATAKPTESAAPINTIDPSAPKVDLQALPVENTTAAPAVPALPSHAAAHAAPPIGATPPASAKATPKATTAPKWRQDPGF